MEHLDLNKELKLSSIERLLESASCSSKSIPVLLPDKIQGSHIFDIETFTLQCIATWMRNSKDTTICKICAGDSNDRDSLESLCSSLFGICTMSLVDEIICQNGEPIKKSKALQPAVTHINAIRKENFISAFDKNYIGIPHIKGPNSKSELNSPLYNNETVVGSDKFTRITENALNAILTKSSHRKYFTGRKIKNLSEIIRELFTNTDKHARRDALGNILGKNFRNITFRLSTPSERDLDDLVKSSGAKIALYASCLGEMAKNSDISFLSISVIDSGPGFAGRWHGKQKGTLTPPEERDAVLACFKKHNTTDPASSSGSGLTNVLRDIREVGGLFRLRTGYALVEKPFPRKNENLDLLGSEIKLTKFYAEGAAINILIPLVDIS